MSRGEQLQGGARRRLHDGVDRPTRTGRTARRNAKLRVDERLETAVRRLTRHMLPQLAPPSHSGSGLPACSATMYSAYQSGQFASCWPPLRFSCSPWAVAARLSAAASSLDE